MKLTESQELFIEVGRIENLLMAMTIGLNPKKDDEEYRKYVKRRRYLLRKARAAYNKEMKHETK